MMANSLFLLILLAAIVWYWFDSQRSHEKAVSICRKLCQQYELQLLDDTVVQRKLGLSRRADGWLQLKRTYFFEFFAGGDNRAEGVLVLNGERLEMFELSNHTERTFIG
ncbi:DUF3301 domain-containing protein [Beggiatoa leptomitoformis]|uniref:DUF3301 domain-containing protein n=1 Tax=Beggiatoa leptomitoformis TaxID=288004 RepID=A0A2N9YFL7_9GAMM|nr:DUF3301 domain-containing protein [Beggiatoa leptomitoformis]ALG68489.1 DUF3301 domain-containing protein [Beggiatoa leptomitoformis]AUI69175.1 DUF3301 domain-containing protein [Beggiatoa leptomitoformis]